jgi:hypothetical protein
VYHRLCLKKYLAKKKKNKKPNMAVNFNEKYPNDQIFKRQIDCTCVVEIRC